VAAQAEIHAAIRRVAESGVGVVIASTDFGELATVCDRILTVRAGRIAGELAAGAISADAVLSSVTADVP
jgi:ribose transport system ATP-binding protein